MNKVQSTETDIYRRLSWLRGAGGAVLVFGLVFSASLLAIKSAWLSGGALVVWPADGLIVGFSLATRTRRPWLVMAAGLLASLLAFCIVGRAMVFALSRVALMSVAIPIIYYWARPLVGRGAIAQPRVLLPFLAVCASVGTATALMRSVVLYLGWGFPIGPLTLTTATATFVGYAIVTPLILLLAQAPANRSTGLKAQAIMWGVVALYTLAMTAAFYEPLYPTVYLVPLALILVAHIVDFTAIVVVILATAAVSVAVTFSGHGAISRFPGDIKEKVLLTQAFLCVLVGTTLPFSAVKSDRERMRLKLVAALGEATHASRAKSAFLATMSHEIRTPLNGVLGMAQAMERDELIPAQRERLAVVRSSGESLLTLLNDVLDLSKIEAGKLTLETIPFDPAELIDAIVRQNQALASHKDLVIHADTAGLDRIYDGDPNRIRQIVQNLVSNAIKFTERGSVTIIASSGEPGLTIEVRDTGMGIPPENLGLLFGKFQQVDDSTTRRFGGTGLGLSICRELAQAMGGDVTVESAAGSGSTFSFFAPLPRSMTSIIAPIAPAEETATLGGDGFGDVELRVLAAEDNLTNQLVLRTLLNAAGVEPTIVENGAKALAAWREADWDLVLMDVQMPVMDGPTAVRQIRKEEAAGARARTLIVALTANTMDHQVREYLDDGMDECMAKPINLNKLMALLVDVEGRRASRLNTPESSFAADGRFVA
jgi:signal transduction histidine kinase/BarA-like signal transduction histidine kinase